VGRRRVEQVAEVLLTQVLDHFPEEIIRAWADDGQAMPEMFSGTQVEGRCYSYRLRVARLADEPPPGRVRVTCTVTGTANRQFLRSVTAERCLPS